MDTDNTDQFLKTQIITYMGNKRKLLPHIRDLIRHVAHITNRPITFADPFSGSGIVARLALAESATGNVKTVIANDLARYSHIANICYLKTPNNIHDRQAISQLISQANALPDPDTEQLWIAKHWAPKDDHNIQNGERCYFTQENARRIDAIRNFIASDHVPDKYKPYLLAPLLAQASIHNNTNGQFAAFYKDEHGIGAFGGKKEIDIKRITQKIILPTPCWLQKEHTQDVQLSRKDTRTWAKDIQNEQKTFTIDLAYFDPPYNKHPYNIYYFLLDIIATWDKSIDIPDSYRGQPKNWIRSPFNSSVDAENAFRDIIKHTPARFIALSYYDAGILSIEQIDNILASYGNVRRDAIRHDTYNRLYGVGAYKRTNDEDKTPAKEYLWLLEKTHN